MKEKLIGKCVRLLHSKYGNKEESSANREIVEQMIFYHLHRTVNITSARNALRSIRNAYIDYNEVRITRQQELSRLLEEAGVPQEKSFVIKGLLRAIFGKESRLCLEHLRELDRARFCERLKKIEGMDDAVIEYILLCTFGEAVLPMSEEVRRVLERYGVPVDGMKGSDAAKYLNYYNKVKPYQAFCLFVEHSQKVCLAEGPRCDRCVLARTCATAICNRKKTRKSGTDKRTEEAVVKREWAKSQRV